LGRWQSAYEAFQEASGVQVNQESFNAAVRAIWPNAGKKLDAREEALKGLL